MKTSLHLSPCTRGSLLLLVFTALSVPDAQCGLPFKRTIGGIKERVTRVVRKIGSEIDRDSPSSSRQVVPPNSDLRYGPPPVSPYQSSSPDSSGFNPDGSRRNGSEVIYSAAAYQPAIILRKPQSSTADSVVPVTVPGSQAVDPGTLPALKDLPMRSPSDSQSASSNATDPASGNKAQRQAPASSQPVSYARPVPGHPGFVYPPGAKEELKNMLDVRGCASGEKMRDPRTGATFLVP